MNFERFGQGALFGRREWVEAPALGLDALPMVDDLLRCGWVCFWVSGQSLQPTGLLWGSGNNHATDRALEHERRFFTPYTATTRLLENHDLRMVRRPLLLRPQQLNWQLDGQQVTVSFTLARGQFATALLRELVMWSA